MKFLSLAMATALMAAVPAYAGNTLIAPGTRVAVAKSTMTVVPDREWNKMGFRPGPSVEDWTIDGGILNDVVFYGGIADGATLFREADKRNKPLPRFSSTMLLTDVSALLEGSYRAAAVVPLMTIDSVEPADFVGSKAVRFTYSFLRANSDVRRKGEAYAAIVSGKLYMITYEAPVLYYFDRDLEAFRRIAASAKL